MERRSGTETRSVSRYDRSAAGAVSLDGRAEKAGFLGSIEEKKAHLAQLSEEYERIMQEKMPVRLLKAFPNARSERYNEALEKSARKSAPNEKERLGINKRALAAKDRDLLPSGEGICRIVRKNPAGKVYSEWPFLSVRCVSITGCYRYRLFLAAGLTGGFFP